MRSMPRILPLVGVAVGGVLAINAVAGAVGAPDLLHGAKAFAEEAAKSAPGGKKAKADDKAAKSEAAPSATDAAQPASAVAPGASPAKPPAVCAPTAAELAKQAGLSPAELQVLQSLGERRGELDQREDQLSTQVALMAAAEAKLDAKIKALSALKSDIQGLVGQANQQEQAETDRLVKVFEAMKPKNAAERITVLDDDTRLPIAAKMKERALSAVIAQMSPDEAKRLTESLAKRFKAAQVLGAKVAATEASAAASAPVPASPAAAQAKAPAPKKQAAAKPKAKPAKTARAKPAAGPSDASTTPKTAQAAPAPAKTAQAAPAPALATPPPAAKPG